VQVGELVILGGASGMCWALVTASDSVHRPK
jgi:hypothetical protein